MTRTTLSFLCVLAIALVFSVGCDRDEQPVEPPRSNAPGGSTAQLEQRTGPGLPVVYPVGPKSPKPTGPLPEGTSCVSAQCHADMTRGTHIHLPVATQACDSCHVADTGEHKFPLKRDEVATCTY